jgi:ABC-type bacteriocin/lantibiotic exporter with double-glycine peptidase domain
MSLKLEDVTYTYSPGTAYEMHALEHINLEIPNGQFVGIIGHTGSGKSTLLNLLTTPGMAYAGKILLDGTELRTVSPESLYETVSCPCPALRASSSRTRWNRRRCAAMTAFSF